MELLNFSGLDKEITATTDYYFLTKEKKYLDFTLGYGCFTWGFSNNRLLDSFQKGISCGINFVRSKRNERCKIIEEVNDLLLNISKMKGILWTVSGSDAIEAAVQISRQYNTKNNRTGIISLKNSYHGCTWLARTLSGERKLNEIFNVPLPNWNLEENRIKAEQLTLNEIKKLISYNKNIGTIIFESVPFSLGIRPWSDEWWKEIEKIQKDNNILIVLDDITGGFGKAAPFTFHERINFSPDIIALGKGLTGGYAPLSCALVGERIFEEIKKDSWSHGHTFQPFIPALFLVKEVVNLTKENNFEKTELRLTEILNNLKTNKKIKNFRGIGLARELELNKNIDELYLERLGIFSVLKSKNSFILIVPQNADNEYWKEINKKLNLINFFQ